MAPFLSRDQSTQHTSSARHREHYVTCEPVSSLPALDHDTFCMVFIYILYYYLVQIVRQNTEHGG
jgi:hypothetical protein